MAIYSNQAYKQEDGYPKANLDSLMIPVSKQQYNKLKNKTERH